MLKRRRTNLEAATDAIAVCRAIPVRYVDVPIESALALAARLNLYAYDAYLLAAAQIMQAPVLTLDLALSNAARKVGIHAPEVMP
jgi:predicted nucleic acid-binding protein